MARPLQKTYSPARPFVVERQDQEDGSITYEVWDHRPETYRRLCSINERDDSSRWSDDDGRPANSAKSDAELIVRVLNDTAASVTKKAPGGGEKNRRPVLIFDPHGLTGETARLGERLVGGIVASHGRQQKAAWTVSLTDWPRASGPATSFDVARKKITEVVEEWCASVGWIDPGAGVDVRVEERDAKGAS